MREQKCKLCMHCRVFKLLAFVQQCQEEAFHIAALFQSAVRIPYVHWYLAPYAILHGHTVDPVAKRIPLLLCQLQGIPDCGEEAP